MTVAENMAFALKIAGVPKEERERRVREAAKLLDLEAYLDRKPKALSGGQRQRVAMGRAIVREPQVFLMDEPLSNLDAKLRVSTRTQIASLQRRLGITTIYVTHDQVEAMTMGDRVAVLKDGVLQQVGTPRELYDHPVNVFVAGFIGSPAMNIADYPMTDDGALIAGHEVKLSREILAEARKGGATTVTLGFRPEDLDVAGESDGFPVVVDVIEELGSDAFVYGHLAGTEAPVGDERAAHQVVARIDPRSSIRRGDTVYFAVRPHLLHAFHVTTGERISEA
jgi:multiple sugar transport system ATP-binding protein